MFLASAFCLGDDYPAELESLKPKLASTARRHDLVTVAVNDPRELSLPSIGIFRIEDAETGEIYTVDTGSKSVREAFNKEALEQRQLLRQLMQRQGIDLIEVETGENYLPKLRHFFAHRHQQLATS